jgi:hypothetical protein
MPSSTAKYVVPYPVSADTVSSLAATVQNLAARVDLLLGESGTLTQAAGATGSGAVVLSRTYPGNTGAAVPGIVIFQANGAFSVGTILDMWVNTWTGTATTITGFTWNWASSPSAPGGRTIQWRFIPVL